MDSHDARSLAVREAISRHRADLVAMVRKRAHELDANEVVQAALVRALSKADQVADPAKAAAWIHRVVRHEIIDELRRRKYHRKLTAELGELVAPSQEKALDCSCSIVQAKLLQPSHAQILLRVVVDGVSVSQAATELGITPNNAMVRLHRARRALEVRLAAHCGTTSAATCDDCGCDARGCCTIGA